MYYWSVIAVALDHFLVRLSLLCNILLGLLQQFLCNTTDELMQVRFQRFFNNTA